MIRKPSRWNRVNKKMNAFTDVNRVDMGLLRLCDNSLR